MKKTIQHTSIFYLLIWGIGIGCVSNLMAQNLTHIKTITGGISPKSVVHNGQGIFFAQNMMYRHNITVYNRQFELVKTIKDQISLPSYGYENYTGKHQGGPVEAAFSHNGQYAWVSNYQMYGKGFDNAGGDDCNTSKNWDKSFVYQINTQNFKIDNIVPVGSVPKFLAVSPNDEYLVVSNWCSGDVSVVNLVKKTVEHIAVGRKPRGVVIDAVSQTAYVTLMGSTKIALVDLKTLAVSYLKNVGSAPRHLCIDPMGRYLYATINGEGKVAKIDLSTKKVVQKINTGRTPRSMALTDDGQFLYVVNYLANSMSKVATSNMEVLETVKTNSKPIGITIDEAQGQIWVACYTGSIMVFEDQTLLPNASYNPLAFEIEPQINALREHLNTQFEVLGLSNITSSVLESTSPKIPHLNTSESKPLPSIAKSSEITTTTPLPKPKTPLPSKPKPKVEVSKQYYLIAGSFDEGKWAADLVNKLKTQGFAQARILSKQGEKLRVCYSWHTTKEAADQEKERLKRELDLETWILVWE